MSRVEEALKRYRDHAAVIAKEEPDEGYQSPYRLNSALQRCDRRDLADEYVKLRDDTPITEEWAAKVRDHDSEQVELWPPGESGQWVLVLRNADRKYRGSMDVTTRGAFRALLLAAGIECDV